MLQWLYSMLRLEIPGIDMIDKVYRNAKKICNNSKRVCKYWSPVDDKERIKRREETKQWEIKTKKMLMHFIVLWLIIIIASIWVCFKYA